MVAAGEQQNCGGRERGGRRGPRGRGPSVVHELVYNTGSEQVIIVWVRSIFIFGAGGNVPLEAK